MTNLKEVSVLGFCLCLLLGPFGCALHVPRIMPLSESERKDLGAFGIAAARFTPNTKFSLPPAGWLERVGRGSAIGARRSLGYGITGARHLIEGAASPAPVLFLELSAISLALGLAFVPPAALIGGVYGATAAEPANAIEVAETALKTMLVQAKAQEAVRDHIVQRALNDARYSLAVLQDQGPSTPMEEVQYRAAPGTGMGAVLEVSLLEVAFHGDWLFNPPLKLRMTAQTKLVRVSDGRVFSYWLFNYEGTERLFSEWASNDAHLLREEFERCYDTLSERIVKQALNLYVLREQRTEKQ